MSAARRRWRARLRRLARFGPFLSRAGASISYMWFIPPVPIEPTDPDIDARHDRTGDP